MNLTLAEIEQLPLAAALFGADGQLIRATPEWRDAGADRVAFAVHGNRLVVAGADAPRGFAPLASRLLDCLDAAAAASTGVHGLQQRILAAALRVVMGRDRAGQGSSDQVMHLARAGIRARSALEVNVDDAGFPCTVASPETAALVLVQLAVNAERHGGARAVTLSRSQLTFAVSWNGRCAGAVARTARRRAERERWGLGFARNAADALGGAVFAPHDAGDGRCTAAFELGLQRLALPLAALRGTMVAKATRAWDEETGLLPGTPWRADARLARAAAAAQGAAGAIAGTDGWCARQSAAGVFVAIAPDPLEDRARDLLDGLAHERALWDGVTEPLRSRIAALASVLGAMLGSPLDRAPALVWNQRVRELAPLFDLTMPVPDCPAVGALDPQLTVFLAAEVGEGFAVEGERMWLRVRGEASDDPLARALSADQPGMIAIT